MKHPLLGKIATFAVGASIAVLGMAIATESASQVTARDGSDPQLQSATQTQIRCRPNQGDPMGRQCRGRRVT